MISGASSACVVRCVVCCLHLVAYSTRLFLRYADVYPYYRYDIFAEANEWLLRALLELPKKPAILNLQTMALMFDKISTGGDLHNGLMNYYGAFVCPSVGKVPPGTS